MPTIAPEIDDGIVTLFGASIQSKNTAIKKAPNNAPATRFEAFFLNLAIILAKYAVIAKLGGKTIKPIKNPPRSLIPLLFATRSAKTKAEITPIIKPIFAFPLWSSSFDTISDIILFISQ
ncbi:MAG: hypothetical protein KAH86_10340 [Methanosarcinales archaeon]|nr:hypothetical protein [Methanosarcinales archaeon]